MRITKVDVYLLDCGVQSARRKPIACRIHTDAGVYGDGEAGIAIGVGAEGAYGMVKNLAAMVVGKDPMNVEAIWSSLHKNTFWGQGAGPIFFAGMSAIDIALLDIKGKALGVPCYQLLGGKIRSELRTYASQLQFGWNDRIGPYGKTEDYVKIVEHCLELGYDAVKLDLTQYDKDAVRIPKARCEGILDRPMMAMIEERMKAIRDSLGYGFDIIVENHARTTLPSATQMGQLCDTYKCMALEEPMGPMNPEMHAELRKKISTPIASGERIYSRWGYYNFFKLNAIQLAQPDICNCGGLTEAKKICDMAEVFDATIQAHVAGAPISTAAALHLEAAIPNFCIHEHHFRSTQEPVAKLCKYNYQPVNGKLTVPDLPGLGQELSDWAIEHALKHDTVDYTETGTEKQ